MLFHPTILALYVGSLLVAFLVLYAVPPALQILRRWDLHSGSELQLNIERKTYLISTLLAYAFGFELLSFFLYIFAAEQLHPLFVGAMCAAGSLYVNAFGYPTLILKLINFLLVGVWLILNYADNRGDDYPLIRLKYGYFLLLAPLILLETFLQAKYFLGLAPDVITSCCGSLFSTGTGVRSSGGRLFPKAPAIAVFYVTQALTTGSGFYFLRKGRGGYLFSGLSALALLVSVGSIFSFISLYIYELPTHACPFCLLQKDYHFIGYPLYLTLLGGAIAGIGTGVLMPFKKIASLSTSLPGIQKKLTWTSILFFLVFTGLVTVQVLLSNLVLE
ncbi:MAG: hypothetical protein HY892_07575 [Deltaproteobacteria bacterium]|nr:hypothetical protein [Deltaproteobacteria bacterium]